MSTLSRAVETFLSKCSLSVLLHFNIPRPVVLDNARPYVMSRHDVTVVDNCSVHQPRIATIGKQRSALLKCGVFATMSAKKEKRIG